MKINETDLTEFFSVLPKEQDEDEKEFFGNIDYEIIEDNIRFEISFSEHFNDVFISLYKNGSENSFFNLQFKNVHEITVNKGKVNSEANLTIFELKDSNLNEIIVIKVNPLRINVKNI